MPNASSPLRRAQLGRAPRCCSPPNCRCAAIWGGGDITWAQFGENMIAVYLGNVLGGTVMVGALYYAAYRD